MTLLGDSPPMVRVCDGPLCLGIKMHSTADYPYGQSMCNACVAHQLAHHHVSTSPPAPWRGLAVAAGRGVAGGRQGVAKVKTVGAALGPEKEAKMEKTCSVCGKTKPADEFYSRGLQCKRCQCEKATRNWRAKHPAGRGRKPFQRKAPAGGAALVKVSSAETFAAAAAAADVMAAAAAERDAVEKRLMAAAVMHPMPA